MLSWLALVACVLTVRSAEVDRSFLPELTWRDGPHDGGMVALAVQEDGKILLGGDFTECNGRAAAGMVRLKKNGEIDESFSTPAGIQRVEDFTFGEDGFIYARGIFTFNGRTSQLDRISYEGVRDENFHGRGTHQPSGFAVDRAGRVTLAGGFDRYYGTTAYLARLLPGGEVDPTFQPHTRPSPILSLCGGGVYLLPEGKLLVAGLFPGVGPNSWTIQRLLPDGAPDPAFVPDDSVTGGIVFGAHIQRNGQIVFTDNHWDGVKRLNADGSADKGFKQRATAGKGLMVLNYAVGPDYRIYTVSGPDAGGEGEKRIDRLNPDGTVDGSFNQGTGASEWVNTSYRMMRARVEKDGGLLVYGNFRAFDGVACSGVVRLKTDLLKMIVATELVAGKLRVAAIGNEGSFELEESEDFTKWDVVANGQFVSNEGEVELPLAEGTGARFFRVR